MSISGKFSGPGLTSTKEQVGSSDFDRRHLVHLESVFLLKNTAKDDYVIVWEQD